MTKYTFFLKNPTIYKFKRHKDSSLVEDSMRIWWHRTWKIKKVIWLSTLFSFKWQNICRQILSINVDRLHGFSTFDWK